MTYNKTTRRRAAEAGWYESSKGLLQVRAMHDAHLVNALLRSLADGDPASVAVSLGLEVLRRNLWDVARAEAVRREG